MNSRGIESVLAPRQVDQRGEGLAPPPPHPGDRADSAIPPPVTRHVPSNTTKRENFADGIYPGSFTDKASSRPTTPTMEQNLDPQSRASAIDSPVPLGTQHPDIAVIDKPTEVRRAQDLIGDEPSGVLKR